MQRRKLGKSGIEVSRMCLGTLTTGTLQLGMAPEAAADLYEAAFKMGVSFFDSAKIYGTYPHMGAFLRRLPRENVVVTAKSYDYTRDGMSESLQKALLEMGTDYIDIYLMHEQESRATLKGHSAGFEYLREAKEKGFIRAIGVSTHSCEVAEAVAEMEFVDVLHPMYNYRGLGIIDGSFDRMKAAVSVAHSAGIGVYAMKVLGGGLMVDELPQALGWAISDPDLDSIALGIANAQELQIDVDIFEGRVVEQGRLAAAYKTKSIIVEEWCTGCGSCAAACRQGAISIKDGRASVDKSECVLCGYCGRACPDFHIRIV